MRLDVYLTEKGIAPSRQRAQNMIKNGEVFVNGKCIEKASYEVAAADVLSVDNAGESNRYVSRGGLKLEAALRRFAVDVQGKTVVDIGASTGGFSDCLLQYGAETVFAVDVGDSQLHPTIHDHPHVVVMDHCNARYLKKTMFPALPDMAVMDVSFISQTMILPVIRDILSENGCLISLIKPQFEVGPAKLSKRGIVTDERSRIEAIRQVVSSACQAGLFPSKIMTSPIHGGDGNVEYLLCSYCAPHAVLKTDEQSIRRYLFQSEEIP